MCGKVQFEAKGPLRGVVACHCSQCRIQTGTYVSATRCATDDLTVIGYDNITWFEASDDAARAFCKTCGSFMFWRGHNNSERTSIMAGCFHEPNDLKLVGHIYFADKGDLYELHDDLPKYSKSDHGELV